MFSILYKLPNPPQSSGVFPREKSWICQTLTPSMSSPHFYKLIYISLPLCPSSTLTEIHPFFLFGANHSVNTLVLDSCHLLSLPMLIPSFSFPPSYIFSLSLSNYFPTDYEHTRVSPIKQAIILKPLSLHSSLSPSFHRQASWMKSLSSLLQSMQPGFLLQNNILRLFLQMHITAACTAVSFSPHLTYPLCIWHC